MEKKELFCSSISSFCAIAFSHFFFLHHLPLSQNCATKQRTTDGRRKEGRKKPCLAVRRLQTKNEENHSAYTQAI